jgi:hypothetical protein
MILLADRFQLAFHLRGGETRHRVLIVKPELQTARPAMDAVSDSGIIRVLPFPSLSRNNVSPLKVTF